MTEKMPREIWALSCYSDKADHGLFAPYYNTHPAAESYTLTSTVPPRGVLGMAHGAMEDALESLELEGVSDGETGDALRKALVALRPYVK